MGPLAITLAAALVERTLTLTIIRVAAPAAVTTAVWATAASSSVDVEGGARARIDAPRGRRGAVAADR